MYIDPSLETRKYYLVHIHRGIEHRYSQRMRRLLQLIILDYLPVRVGPTITSNCTTATTVKQRVDYYRNQPQVCGGLGNCLEINELFIRLFLLFKKTYSSKVVCTKV